MRGEIWSVAGGRSYAGKPRPCLILQNDAYGDLPSVTILPLTSTPPKTDLPLLRSRIEPHDNNGLAQDSWAQIDKIITVPRTALGHHIGRLDRRQLTEIGGLIVASLGI